MGAVLSAGSPESVFSFCFKVIHASPRTAEPTDEQVFAEPPLGRRHRERRIAQFKRDLIGPDAQRIGSDQGHRRCRARPDVAGRTLDIHRTIRQQFYLRRGLVAIGPECPAADPIAHQPFPIPQRTRLSGPLIPANPLRSLLITFLQVLA